MTVGGELGKQTLSAHFDLGNATIIDTLRIPITRKEPADLIASPSPLIGGARKSWPEGPELGGKLIRFVSF
jgi:hypothetical protein